MGMFDQWVTEEELDRHPVLIILVIVQGLLLLAFAIACGWLAINLFMDLV